MRKNSNQLLFARPLYLAFGAGLLGLVATDIAAYADPAKPTYDRKIKEAATRLAGQKVGGLRGMFDGEEEQAVVPIEVFADEPPEKVEQPTAPIIIQRRSWQIRPNAEQLPPLVNLDRIDAELTGSIDDRTVIAIKRARELNPYPW